MAPHWLLINLDRSPDRRSMMEQQLAALGLAFTRVPAIDANHLSMARPELDLPGFWRDSAMRMRTTDAACFLSHLKAIETFLAGHAQHAVVLEDDVLLGQDVPALVATLTGEHWSTRWDMVKLTGNNTARILPCRRIDGRYALGVPWTRLPGAAAYLINRRAARVYLDRLCPMTVLYDHAFDRGWALGLRTRAITPLPASGVTSCHSRQSTIDTADRPRVKNRGLGRITSLWWRTKNEVGRFAYAAVCAFRERLPAGTAPAELRSPAPDRKP